MRSKQSDAKDPFQIVYRMLRAGEKPQAANLLISRSSGKLRPLYAHDPNHAWYIMGTIRFDQGNFKAAIKAFRRALVWRTDDVSALWALGDCYAELGRPRFAEKYFAAALEIAGKKDRLALAYNLGNSLYDQGRFRDAIEQYLRARRSADPILARMAERNLRSAREKQVMQIKRRARLSPPARRFH